MQGAEDYRHDFLDLVTELCDVLDIEVPCDQDGDVIVYDLELDEISFRIKHSMKRLPGSMLVECRLGRLLDARRAEVMQKLLEANLRLANDGCGALALDTDPAEVIYALTLTLENATAPAMLDSLVAIRDIARDWKDGYLPPGVQPPLAIRQVGGSGG